jgi:RND family efflux transporter MFP subunit
MTFERAPDARGRPRAGRRAALAALLLCALPGMAGGQVAPVAVAEATRAAIVDPVRLNGTVVSPRVARVSGEVEGRVARMEVALGDPVEAGAPLVRLDRDFGRLDLDAAAAETREARARLADARRRLEDGERLAADDTLPRNEVEVRRLAVRRAEARLARLETAEAYQRERLARHVIRAPFAGVVAERIAEAGEWVEPGTAVVELVATDRLLVEVPVPQRYFGAVTEDATARLRFDAAPGRTVPAEVAARVPVSDPTARTFRLRLRPEAEGLALTPGMSARVTLRLETGEEGITIPRDALVRYPDGRTTVWVVEPGDPPTVAERQVRIGRSFDGRIVVTGGLGAGTRVVTRGNEALSPGQQVRLAGDRG